MDQISFDDLLMEDTIEEKKPKNESPLHTKVSSILKVGENSALEICEQLIEEGYLSKERFSTNKPKAYGQVCIILEDLVKQGKLVFVKELEKTDRVYEMRG
ncbi:DUF3895 domain-containing protein [Metabacillus malikii]|uniref:DUF3895 domain-containing protein n=1 Tax=Metabacillus malikii TaxID=1504265 RepID=A0ABT9ZID3_9BACI|nr:DUF3895 domain-containing protein [Metabacillus malikii]MDQ0232022.1 hypothetical protein [Metabacillus malikii]